METVDSKSLGVPASAEETPRVSDVNPRKRFSAMPGELARQMANAFSPNGESPTSMNDTKIFGDFDKVFEELSQKAAGFQSKSVGSLQYILEIGVKLVKLNNLANSKSNPIKERESINGDRC